MRPPIRSRYSVQSTPYMGILSEDQLEEIHLASLEILRRTGARVFSEEALQLLRKAGARIADGNHVFFPPSLVEWAIRSAPEAITISNRDGEPAMRLENSKVFYGTGSDTMNVIDPYTGERRPWTRADIVNGMKICDYLPNIDFVMCMGVAQDVNWAVADRHHFEAMVTTTKKPIVYTAYDADGLRDIVDMQVAVAGSLDTLHVNPIAVLYIEPISPLKHAQEQMEKLLFMAERGLPMIYIAGMMRGATGPVTMAGSVALANAEALSGLTIAQLKREGTPVIHGGGILNMDMRTGAVSYTPELWTTAAALATLAQYYKLPAWGYAGLSLSKALDPQAGIESTVSILTAALSGANLVHDVGYLDSGMSNSFESLVMGDEVISLVRSFMGGMEVNDETLALDVIHKVGPDGNFLSEEHTLKHFRESWSPTLLDLENYENWAEAGKLTLGDKANAKVRWILENHVPEPLNQSTCRALKEIMERAESMAAQTGASR